METSNPLSQLRNGLKVHGKKQSDGSFIVLADKNNNTVLGIDANGNYFGNAFTPRTQAVTATADGLTTGLIKDNVDYVTVTSANAIHAVTLPACSAGTIGREITLFVGANGIELLTPATGNNTINGVDSDGTNQLDVSANTVVRLIQVSATGWYAFLQTTTALSVVAPDND